MPVGPKILKRPFGPVDLSEIRNGSCTHSQNVHASHPARVLVFAIDGSRADLYPCRRVKNMIAGEIIMAAPLSLSKVERLILANQYLILEKVDPNNEPEYVKVRQAIEHGYELEIATMAEQRLLDPLSFAECEEVREILDMHMALYSAVEECGKDIGIALDDVGFEGFDGSKESRQLAYVEFLLDTMDYYSELQNANGFNSHVEMLPKYQRMLSFWKASEDRVNLTGDDVKRILG
jgi:uncharacterized protein YfbU (UPF0304 family)